MSSKITYKDAGVDTHEGERAVELMKHHVKKTFGPEVLTGLGSFGSLFKPDLRGISSPVLVAGSDGVGTKLRIAQLMDVHDTVGIDLVAMCANDVICQGARPLFFLDYIAASHVEADKMAELVKGVADGCMLAGCALVGGETAEMPGFYADDDYDMAGFCVGIVDEVSIIDGSNVTQGDVIIGLASSGIHSNGYSLVRKLLFEKEGLSVRDTLPGFEDSIGELLLTPTRIYANEIASLLSETSSAIHALCHITGGGFIENIPRVIPEGLAAEVELGSWDVPPVFSILHELSGMDDAEVFNTLNMGIGMIAIVSESDAEACMDALRAPCMANGAYMPVRIGRIVKEDKLSPRVLLKGILRA